MPNWSTNTLTGKKEILSKYINKEGDFDFNLVIPMPETLHVDSGSIENEAIIYYLSDRLTVSIDEYINKANKVKESVFFSNYYSKEQIEGTIERIKEGIENYKNLSETQKAEKEAQAKKCGFYFTDYSEDGLYELGKTYISNYTKYGYTTWYDWSYENWGTKWNACGSSIEDNKDGTITIHFSTAWSSPAGILRKIINDYQDEKFVFTYYNEDWDGFHIIKFYGDGTCTEEIEDEDLYLDEEDIA